VTSLVKNKLQLNTGHLASCNRFAIQMSCVFVRSWNNW